MARVLVVDDDRVVCDLLSQKLPEWGHDAVTASDGIEALEKTESEEFDLVLSDWKMPRMSGSELCETLKSGERTKDIPVILIGAKQAGSSKLDHWETEAYDAGAVDYMTKPFSLDDLQSRLSMALLQ